MLFFLGMLNEWLDFNIFLMQSQVKRIKDNNSQPEI